MSTIPRVPPLLRYGAPRWAGFILAGFVAVALSGLAHAANPEAYRLNEAAVAEVRKGNTEAALGLLLRANALDPQDGAIRSNLVRVRTVMGHRLAREGRLQEAEALYRAALDVEPNEVSAWLGLGNLQLRQRDPRGAADSFQRAVAAQPDNTDAVVGLGEAYYNQGDLGGALREWERAAAARPQDSGLRERIARVRREAAVQADYRSRESQHFTVTYEGRRQEDIGRELVALLERAYNDVGYALGAYPSYAVQTILYSDQDFMAATGRSTQVGGFYHLLDGKIRIALRGLQPQDPLLGAILCHEYTHALIYAISRGNNPPRWLHEGLAVHMEQLRASDFKAEALRRARAGARDSLETSPYIMGSVAVEHLVDRYGMAGIRLLLQRLGEGTPFGQAFQETFQTNPGIFEGTVRDVVTRGY